jgi:hypothetical protein
LPACVLQNALGAEDDVGALLGVNLAADEQDWFTSSAADRADAGGQDAHPPHVPMHAQAAGLTEAGPAHAHAGVQGATPAARPAQPAHVHSGAPAPMAHAAPAAVPQAGEDNPDDTLAELAQEVLSVAGGTVDGHARRLAELKAAEAALVAAAERLSATARDSAAAAARRGREAASAESSAAEAASRRLSELRATEEAAMSGHVRRIGVIRAAERAAEVAFSRRMHELRAAEEAALAAHDQRLQVTGRGSAAGRCVGGQGGLRGAPHSAARTSTPQRTSSGCWCGDVLTRSGSTVRAGRGVTGVGCAEPHGTLAARHMGHMDHMGRPATPRVTAPLVWLQEMRIIEEAAAEEHGRRLADLRDAEGGAGPGLDGARPRRVQVRGPGGGAERGGKEMGGRGASPAVLGRAGAGMRGDACAALRGRLLAAGCDVGRAVWGGVCAQPGGVRGVRAGPSLAGPARQRGPRPSPRGPGRAAAQPRRPVHGRSGGGAGGAAKGAAGELGGVVLGLGLREGLGRVSTRQRPGGDGWAACCVRGRPTAQRTAGRAARGRARAAAARDETRRETAIGSETRGGWAAGGRAPAHAHPCAHGHARPQPRAATAAAGRPAARAQHAIAHTHAITHTRNRPHALSCPPSVRPCPPLSGPASPSPGLVHRSGFLSAPSTLCARPAGQGRHAARGHRARQAAGARRPRGRAAPRRHGR